ncbi:MAG: sugar ABC transporter substrate-binding protein [Oscillochloridaceae bacterium umkhey_bin13]
MRYLFALFILSVLVGCSLAPAPLPPTRLPTPVAEVPALPPRPTATPQPTPSPAPSPTPTPRSLTLWLSEREPATGELVALINEAAVSQGLALKVIVQPADALRLSLATARLLDEPLPDLIWADQEALAGLLVDGALQPMPATTGLADALPALLTAATLDGQRWGAPISTHNHLFLLYNRDLIETPPATIADMLALTRARQNREVTGLVMAWNEVNWVLPWLHAFGGSLTSPDGQTITLDTPAMTPTLSLLREMHTASSEGSAGYLRAQRLFAQGYAAMLLDGDWALARYRAVSETLKLGIAPLPRPAGSERPAVPTLGGTYLMLGATLTGFEREQALALINAFSTPTVQARLVAMGHLPASQAALALLPAETDPALLVAAKSAPQAPGLPPTPGVRCARYGLAVWLPSVYSGRLALDQAPATMQREAEACLRRES